MEIIQNNKGGNKLCYAGYLYTRKAKSKNTIRWECSQRSGLSCKGAISTNHDVDIVISTKEHNHDPSPNTTSVVKLRQQIKENSRVKKIKTNQILAEAMLGATTDVRAAVGKPETIRRDIRRQKRGPKEPASLSDLKLEGDWTTTGGADPKPFLIHDSGPDATNRVLVFASQDGLRLLARTSQWHMDGNYSMSPKISMQVYVIRVPFGDSAVSCVYALLPGKSQVIYEELLQAIVTHCDQLGFNVDPTTIITDFESAVIQAARNIFGDHVRTQGCYYHLTQSTWRKIQELGLVQLYKSSASIKQFCGMLDGLALLPLNDVVAGMELLKDMTPDGLEELVSYFDSTYVSGSFRRIQPPAGPDGQLPPLRLRRRPPCFPPEIWNVFQVTLDGGDRTNNICEGWNNSFQELIGHQHPSIWVLVEGFQQDHALVMTAVAQDRIGERLQKKCRKHQKTFNTRLMNLCKDRANDTKSIEQFLEGIGACIRFT